MIQQLARWIYEYSAIIARVFFIELREDNLIFPRTRVIGCISKFGLGWQIEYHLLPILSLSLSLIITDQGNIIKILSRYSIRI